MANDKEIKIRAVLDASGFDSQVNKLQQKLKQMQQTQEGLGKAQNNFSGDKLMGSYAKQAFGDFSKDSKKQLEDMYQSQRREAMNQKINLKSKEQELKNISTIEGEMTKAKKAQVDLLEKEIQLLKQKQTLTIQNASKTKEILGQIKGGDAGSGAGGQDTGSGGGLMGGFKSMLKAIGIGAIVKGALNAVVTGAQHVVERDRSILASRGASAQMASREMREEWQGQGSKGIFYAGQRQKAMQMAAEEQKSQGALDFGRIGKNMAVGAAGGALVGSLLPGVGNVAGGIVGAIGGFTNSMGSDKLRSRVFDQEQYQQMMTKEGMQKYEGNLAAQKALDPRRTMAQEYWQGNHKNIQQLQRSGGMSDDQLLGRSDNNLFADGQAAPNTRPNFDAAMKAASNIPQKSYTWDRTGRKADWTDRGYTATGEPMYSPENMQGMSSDAIMGGLIGLNPAVERKSEGYLIDQMKGGTNKGQFSQENIMRQRSSILSGGGATSEQNLASTAANYERQLNMQNAGDVFGKITGSGMGQGEGAQSEDAIKRLLAEGTKMGIIASDMPQEMKRFTSAAADIMTQGGGLSNTATSRFAQGLGGTTAADIASGKSAYDEARGNAKGAAGMEGQIGMGFLMGKDAGKILGKDKDGKQRKLGARHLNQINQMSADELERDPKLAKGLALELGISEDKLMELVKAKDAKKQTRTQGLEDLVNEYGAMSDEEKDTDKGLKSYSKIQGMRGQEKGKFLQKSAIDRKSAVGAMQAFQNVGDVDLSKSMSSIEGQLNKGQDTAANAQEQSTATGDITKIKALRENIDELKKAAKTHTEAAELYNEQFDKFIKAVKGGGDALGTMKGQLDDVIKMLAENGFAASEPN